MEIPSLISVEVLLGKISFVDGRLNFKFKHFFLSRVVTKSERYKKIIKMLSLKYRTITKNIMNTKNENRIRAEKYARSFISGCVLEK